MAGYRPAKGGGILNAGLAYIVAQHDHRERRDHLVVGSVQQRHAGPAVHHGQRQLRRRTAVVSTTGAAGWRSRPARCGGTPTSIDRWWPVQRRGRGPLPQQHGERQPDRRQRGRDLPDQRAGRVDRELDDHRQRLPSSTTTVTATAVACSSAGGDAGRRRAGHQLIGLRERGRRDQPAPQLLGRPVRLARSQHHAWSTPVATLIWNRPIVNGAAATGALDGQRRPDADICMAVRQRSRSGTARPATSPAREPISAAYRGPARRETGAYQYERCNTAVINVVGTDEGTTSCWGLRAPTASSPRAVADRVVAAEGADRVCGGPGGDDLFGGTGRDVLVGSGGDDSLNGGPGSGPVPRRRGQGPEGEAADHEDDDKAHSWGTVRGRPWSRGCSESGPPRRRRRSST